MGKREEQKAGLDERLAALLAGKRTDRVPFYLFALGFCGKCVGYSVHDIYADAEKSFFAQVWAAELYDCEAIPRLGIASYGAWEFGGELGFPKGDWAQAPWVKRYPIQSEEDVERLTLPDVKTAGLLPLQMEVCRRNKAHGLPLISFSVGSPFSRASNLCGIETLGRWMVKKPKLAHRLLRLFTDHLLHVAQYWVETFGSDRLLPFEGMPVESNQVISPKHFLEFALPYLKELNERMIGMGIKHIFCHFCGEQNSNLPFLADVPLGDPGIASFGHEVDLTSAIEHLGDRAVIAGNVEPTVILTGTPQEVYELAVQCIDKAKHAPRGYLMMPGCEMPPLAPPYNVYMIRKAIDDFGWYD